MSASSSFRGWRLFFCGLCMGVADLVPGISGGTVAFLLGCYEPLLESLNTLNSSALHHLLKGRWRLFSEQVAWKFLVTLLAGIACAMIGFAHLLHKLLSDETHRIHLYALFLGLIVASFFFCVRQVTNWYRLTYIEFCLGGLVAFLLTGTTLVPPAEGNYAIPLRIEVPLIPLRNYDLVEGRLTGLSAQMLGALRAQGRVEDSTAVYDARGRWIGEVAEWATPRPTFFFDGWLAVCGALAICAFLLPGISGSYLLTLLGVYPMVMAAFVDFFQGLKSGSFDPEAFSTLASLGLGIVLGAMGFTRLVSALWRRYPDHLLALLSGFIMGAIRSVWPFWSYEYALAPLKLDAGPQLIPVQPFLPDWDSLLVWKAIACALAGFLLVLAFNGLLPFCLTRKAKKSMIRNALKPWE